MFPLLSRDQIRNPLKTIYTKPPTTNTGPLENGECTEKRNCRCYLIKLSESQFQERKVSNMIDNKIYPL